MTSEPQSIVPGQLNRVSLHFAPCFTSETGGHEGHVILLHCHLPLVHLHGAGMSVQSSGSFE
jgi:hypothetical protein